MKKIRLTKDFYALVDDEDYSRTSIFSWSATTSGATTYARRAPTKANRHRSMHRFILEARSGQIIDHIDGNGLNNRRSNLRFVTLSENAMNSRVSKNNKSGFKGVVFYKKNNKWSALIRPPGKKQLYLGLFETKEEAARAYDKAAKEFHGRFANLNFPEAKNEINCGI